MILDFRDIGNLTTSELVFLDQNVNKIDKNFQEYLFKLKERNKKKKFYFVLTLINSNNFSDLFKLFSRITLLENYINKKQKIDKILVDDKYTKNILEQILNKNSLKCKFLISPKINKSNSFLKFLILIYKITIDFICSFSYKNKKYFYKETILIDSYISFNDLNYNKINDKYFGNYENYLSNKDINRIFYFPRILERNTLNIFKLLRVLKKFSKHKREFLLDISSLNFLDFLFCFKNSIFIPLQKYHIPKFNDLDLDKFCKHQLLNDFCSIDVLISMYRYKAIERLKKYKDKISGVIMWFENHAIDKTSIHSYKKNLNHSLINAYHGYFLYKTYSSIFVNKFEFENNLGPDIISCISYYCIEKYDHIKNYSKFYLAPAFRYAYLFDINLQKNKANKRFIISLTAYREETRRLLLFTNSIIKDFNNYEIILTIHPTMRAYAKKLFKKYLNTMSQNNIKISKLSSNKIIQNCDLVITCNSNIAVEASLLNIPVGICSNRNSITMNPLSSNITNSKNFIFYNYSELKFNIKKILNQQNSKINHLHSNDLNNKILNPNKINTTDFFSFRY